MSKYYDTLGDKAVSIAQMVTDKKSVMRVVGYPVLVQAANEGLTQLALRGECMPGDGFNETKMASILSNAAVEDLAGILQRVSNVTFNDAVPMVKDVMETMKQVINPDIPVAYSTSEIIPIIYDDIWNSPFVMELSTRGRSMKVPQVSYAGMIRSIADEAYADLVQLAMVGLPALDDSIKRIIGGFSEADLRGLFVNTFMNGWLPNQRPLDLIVGDTAGGLQRDQWLIIHQWAQNLRNVAPRDSAFDLARYRMNLTALEELCAWVVAGVDSMRNTQSKDDILIVKVQGARLFVNNDLYVNYLRDGGTPEAVLGVSLIEKAAQFKSSFLKAEKEMLEKAWSRHVQITTVKHSEQMNGTARRQLHLALEKTAMARLQAKEGETTIEASVRNGTLKGVLDTIAKMVHALPTDFTRDLHRWVFSIVSNAFYPDSDVGLLLNCLCEVGDRKDSGLSAEEIRVIAVINFVADWLANSVRIDHA